MCSSIPRKQLPQVRKEKKKSLRIKKCVFPTPTSNSLGLVIPDPDHFLIFSNNLIPNSCYLGSPLCYEIQTLILSPFPTAKTAISHTQAPAVRFTHHFYFNG